MSSRWPALPGSSRRFPREVAGDQAGGLKFLYEAEHRPLLDPVGIEDPVEMVALMLDDARVKLLRLPLDLRPSASSPR